MLALKLTVLLAIALTGAMGAHVNDLDVGYPLNTVVVVSETAKLYCKYYSTRCERIRWQKEAKSGQATNISDGIRVYDGSKYRLDYSSYCVLVIANVQPTDSGIFVCTITGQGEGRAELIVLGAKPKCSSTCKNDSTLEKEKVDYKCQLKYKGGTRLAMTWRNERTRLDVAGVRAATQDNTSISRDFSYFAQAPGFDPLLCLTWFYVSQTPARADNVPNIQCETRPCNISYSVRNVVISPPWLASPGETMTCKADGNPPPTFQWQSKDGDEEWTNVEDETSETIEAFVSNGTSSTKIRCVAKNEVSGKELSVESAEVEVSENGATKRIAIIVGVIVAVVVVAIIAGVIYKFVLSG